MSLSKKLAEFVNSGALDHVFKGKHSHKFLKTLDYYSGPPKSDPTGAAWTIQLMSTFPDSKHRSEVICLFPNHKDAATRPKRRILRASSYFNLANFNIALNEKFGESLSKTDFADRIKVAFVYGQNVYVCKEVEGTIYLVYAEYICRVNQGNVPNTGFEQCPLIINCDGQSNIKSIFVLKSELKNEFDLAFLPFSPGNPVIRRPRDPIFVCETKPPEAAKREIKSLSRVIALQKITMTTTDTRRWVAFEKNVFVKEVGDDSADLDVDGLSWSDDQQDVMIEGDMCETPRGVLSLIRDAAGAVERDPFEDDDDDEENINNDEKQKQEYIV